MPVTAMLIGGGLGLAKNELIDKPAAARQLKLQAAKEAYSPWTGEKGTPVQDPNAIGAIMQGAGSGAAMGQGMQNASAQTALQQALAARLNTGGDITGSGKTVASPDSPWDVSPLTYQSKYYGTMG